MTNQILIQKCLLIIKKIKEHIEEKRVYYICIDSSIENACEDIVPLLRSYGLKYLEGFYIDIYDSGAFRYLNIILPEFGVEGRAEYNQAKINHIKSFIAWLEEGGDIALIEN